MEAYMLVSGSLDKDMERVEQFFKTKVFMKVFGKRTRCVVMGDFSF
jgi:hypothetical protein